MDKNKYIYLPDSNNFELENLNHNTEINVSGDSPCPCCGYITIPNDGDAIGYICPVCYWEIDLFIKDVNDVSDLNNGLTLNEAIVNYKKFGSILPRFLKYCRKPKESEQIL